MLRTKNIGEYNKLVFLFTRPRGRVKAIAYGARKIKNRFGSSLEPFTHGYAHLLEKKGRNYISLDQMDIILSSFTLYEDYIIAAHLYYYAELLDLALPEEQAEENIFRLTLEMLKGFNLKLAPNLVAAYFEVWLLKLLGLLPEYKSCYYCGATLKNQKDIYLAKDGFLFCSECYVKGIGEGSKISSELINVLSIIFKNKIDSREVRSMQISRLPLTEWTHSLFSNMVERDIKSYTNLKEIRKP